MYEHFLVLRENVPEEDVQKVDDYLVLLFYIFITTIHTNIDYFFDTNGISTNISNQNIYKIDLSLKRAEILIF
jgi:hypothetical protein